MALVDFCAGRINCFIVVQLPGVVGLFDMCRSLGLLR